MENFLKLWDGTKLEAFKYCRRYPSKLVCTKVQMEKFEEVAGCVGSIQPDIAMLCASIGTIITLAVEDDDGVGHKLSVWGHSGD